MEIFILNSKFNSQKEEKLVKVKLKNSQKFYLAPKLKNWKKERNSSIWMTIMNKIWTRMRKEDRKKIKMKKRNKAKDRMSNVLNNE